MAAVYSTVAPLEFLHGLQDAGVIEHVYELWENPKISTLQTDNGLVQIASKASWKRWLYRLDGKPPKPPGIEKTLLLGIKFNELVQPDAA